MHLDLGLCCAWREKKEIDYATPATVRKYISVCASSRDTFLERALRLPEVLQLLLAARAEPPPGALGAAAAAGETLVVQLLCDAGAPKNSDGAASPCAT